MKTVVTIDQVIKLFIAQTQPSARCQMGRAHLKPSIWFKGPVLWSYNLPIVRLVHHDGQRWFVKSIDSTPRINRMIDRFYRKIPHVLQDSVLYTVDDVMLEPDRQQESGWLERMNAWLVKSHHAKTNGYLYLQYALSIWSDRCAFSSTFNRGWSTTKPQSMIVLEVKHRLVEAIPQLS